MTNDIIFGHFSIGLPDETSSVFTIFEDLADFFDTEFQSEAVILLKNELKKIALKPNPNIDLESDFTHIDSKSADTIFAVAKIIIDLTVPQKRIQPSKNELDEIYSQLKKWKRPPKTEVESWRLIFCSYA